MKKTLLMILLSLKVALCFSQMSKQQKQILLFTEVVSDMVNRATGIFEEEYQKYGDVLILCKKRPKKYELPKLIHGYDILDLTKEDICKEALNIKESRIVIVIEDYRRKSKGEYYFYLGFGELAVDDTYTTFPCRVIQSLECGDTKKWRKKNPDAIYYWKGSRGWWKRPDLVE